MFETVAILVVFFIIVGVGFIFYSSINKTMITREAKDRTELKSIEAAQRLTYLPEIKCTSSVAKEIGSCVDYYKIKMFKRMFESNPNPKEYYYDILGFATIKVTELYPGNEEIVIYDYPKPNWESMDVYQIPVVLLKEGVRISRCGPEFSNAECDYAVVERGVYSGIKNHRWC